MDKKTRAELHTHTKFSDEASVISVQEVFENAKALGLHAIAFTDADNILNFPEIMKYAQCFEGEIHAIYGVTVQYFTDDKPTPFKASLLVKDQKGIGALYRVLSSIRCVDGHKVIDQKVLFEHRKHLLVGSCGNEGALFSALQDGNGDMAAAFYDYFEIFPSDSDEDARIYQQIYTLGEVHHIPVIAASNAHCIHAADAICCDMVNDYNGSTRKVYSGHIRTAADMLEAFSYLGKDGAAKVVFEHPDLLVSLIEPVTPLQSNVRYPVFEHAVQTVRDLCCESAVSIYGSPLPLQVRTRLDNELTQVQDDGIATTYLIAKSMTDLAKTHNAPTDTVGTIGSLFIAYLLGISDINPLPPHYRCPHCLHFETTDLTVDSSTAPKKHCPKCHRPLVFDGYHIPYETALGATGEKIPSTDLRFPYSFQPTAAAHFKSMFDPQHIARVKRTIYFTDAKADACISYYESQHNLIFPPQARQRYMQNISGIKCGEDIYPYGYVALPSDCTFEDFTPLDRSKTNGEQCVHFSPIQKLFKMNILENRILEMLHMLENSTGVCAKTIPFDDQAVYELLCSEDTVGLPEFDNKIVATVVAALHPKTFTELIKIEGLLHGTGVWTENGACLLKAGIPLCALPATREDIFYDLLRVTDHKTAYKYSEGIRKGWLASKRFTDEEIRIFKNITAPLGAWYFDYCSKIHYMFPKAQAVAYAARLLRLAWFKCHYPQPFGIAYANCITAKEG